MNGKPFRKKCNKQNRKKTLKMKVKLPHVNKKQLARKRNFVQTPFSHSTLKLGPKISRRKTTRFFASFRLRHMFWRDHNHYSNLTSKVMKICEQIFKKKTAPQYNSNSLNCNIAFVSGIRFCKVL